MPHLQRLHYQLILHHTRRSTAKDHLYEALESLGPATVKMLITILYGKVSSAAIYTNLKTFQQIGIVEQIQPGLFELTDRFTQHHHYFWCRNCGKRATFYDEGLEKAINRLAQRRYTGLEEHKVELSGLCALCCQAQAPRSSIGLNLRRQPSR